MSDPRNRVSWNIEDTRFLLYASARPEGPRILRVSDVDAPLALCFYAFMRTTVELAPDLLRLAKSRSAERGESLKSLLTRAVAAEVGQALPTDRSRPRMVLPLFGDAAGPVARVTNAVLAARLAEADAAALATSAPSPARKRRPRDAPRR